VDAKLELLSQRLESLRQLTGKLKDVRTPLLDKTISIKASDMPTFDSKVVSSTPSAASLADVAKEFLPKKRGRPTKEEEESADKKIKKIKTVVPIVKKKT